MGKAEGNSRKGAAIGIGESERQRGRGRETEDKQISDGNR